MKYSVEKAVRAGEVVGRLRVPVRGLTINVAATGSAVGFGTAVIQDLPTGRLSIVGAKANLTFTTADTDIAATWSGDYSIGSAPTADASLSAAEVNLIPSTAVGPAVARVSPATEGALAAPFILDNSDGSGEINLNLLVDAANITDDTDADFTVDGYLDLLVGVL